MLMMLMIKVISACLVRIILKQVKLIPAEIQR